MVQPEILRFKVYEPLTLVGLDKFQGIDIRVKVTGGGHVSQVYAIRQAIAKGLVAYHQKYVDEASKNELKKIFASYDKTLLVADSRRMEPKKFGGRCQSKIPKILPLRRFYYILFITNLYITLKLINLSSVF